MALSERLPPLTALRAFEAAARHLSFAKAAEELYVTPAALSYQIKSLETDADVEAYIISQLAAINVTPTRAEALSDPTTGIVSTLVVVPASEFQILGYFSALTNLQVPVTAQHMREDWSA